MPGKIPGAIASPRVLLRRSWELGPTLVADTRAPCPAGQATLAELLPTLGPCDLVLVEGFSARGDPQDRVHRQGGSPSRCCIPHDPHIVAIATDA